MRKSLRVLRRDALRLFRTPKTWVILLGVLITPALYAWFNIAAFWDPYSNTDNITVAVANLDEGATSDMTGEVNVGAEVMEQLAADHQLGWKTMTDAEAIQAVESGEAYAAFVIPAEFSTDFLSVTTGTFTAPTLRYYVNEKASAVSPKITDTGATKLEEKITGAFTEKVALAATEALKDAGDSLELALLNAKSDSLNLFDETSQAISSAREQIDGLSSGISDSRADLSSARGTLTDIGGLLGDVQRALAQAQSVITEAQGQVITFTDVTTDAYVQATTLLADAAAAANVSVSKVTGAFDQVTARIDAALANITAVVEANGQTIAGLQQLIDEGDLDPAVAEQLTAVLTTLQERNAADQQLLADLTELNDDVAGTAQSVQDASDALTSAMQTAQTSASDLRTILTQTVPALNQAMSSLSTSAGAFSAALGAQRGQLDQATTLLDALDTQLASTADAVGSLDADLAGIQSGVDTARTDVMALSSAAAWSDLSTLTGLDTQQIAQFIASPVTVTEHVVFPVKTYGSAMAALFTNLSLWIGAFVLMVIFKIEVDTEGIEPITVGQAYMGRFFLLSAIAGGQALIVSVGNLILGVQTVNAVAFVLTAVLVSFAYLSIIYALSVAFGHVGRGLCVLLVIMQIPGASGLYPIEMMPAFFRNIYPFLPFTYGIDAMRETIAGFYDGQYWRAMGVLGVFVALSFVVGLVLRRRLSNLNLVFNREIHATDLLIGEDVQITGGSYRLSDLIHALSGHDHSRDDIRRRGEFFARRYGALLRATVLTGVAGIAVLSVAAWMYPQQKATFLFVWLLWCLLVIGFLVAIEYIKQSFDLAAEVGDLDDDELRRAILSDGPRRRPATAQPDGALSPGTAATAVLTTERDAPTTQLPVADAATAEPSAEPAPPDAPAKPEARDTSAEPDALTALFGDEATAEQTGEPAEVESGADVTPEAAETARPGDDDEGGEHA